MSAGQRWSTQKPTVPGWYWWKDPAFVLSGDTKVVYISDSDLRFDCGPTAQWCGPLTPPADITPNEEV